MMTIFRAKEAQMTIRKTVTGIFFSLLFCSSSFAYEIRLLSDIPLNGKPSAIAVDTASDTASVISESGKSLSIIDTRLNAVAHEIQLSETPAAVAVYKAGNRALVSTREGHLLLFDLNSGEQTGNIDVGTVVYSLIVDESNGRAILGVDGGLKIIDLSKGEISPGVTLAGKSVLLSHGKAGIYIVSSVDSGPRLTLIDPSTGIVTKDAPLSGEVLSIGLDDSLGFLLLTMKDKPGLALYYSKTLQPLGAVDTGSSLQILSVNPST